MLLYLLAFVLATVCVIGAMWYVLYRWQHQVIPHLLEELFLKSAGLVSDQHRSLMSSEQARIQSDLERQHKSIESMVHRIESTFKERQYLLQQSEKDRSASFATLTEQLQEQRKAVDQLQFSTGKLAELLDHNQMRGQWGETMIEDLLQANGLVEGTHYQRQRIISGTDLIPDISLLLPEKASISIDVKFPFAELITLQNSKTDAEKKQAIKKFGQLVSVHIKKVAEYIQPEHGTLDFSILFIPSEMVFSFINQELPETVQLAMRERVLLVSPFTLIVVALTIRESYRNFLLSDTLREAAVSLESFIGEWKKSKESWEKHGKLLTQLQRSYEEITGARARQLERKVALIEKANKGVLAS